MTRTSDPPRSDPSSGDSSRLRRKRSPGSSQGRVRVSRYAGRYELIGLLGVGGMGSVYRVKDRFLDEEVALKILRKDLAGSKLSVARFYREV
ncbi:MAG TPA: hypothetical protein PLI95_05920, partial [Polyangiaceae bacterium]|nr:hypothetical protein [Polyangiaceae bacterium]